jgi:hypothetical protein
VTFETISLVFWNIAQVVVNSAKIENDFIRITGASHGTGFIEEQRSEIKKIGESN